MMIRPTLLAVVVVVGLIVGAGASCGGDDADPHVLTTCTGWVDNQGNPITGQCEAACAAPPASTGDSCDTKARLGCPAFVFSGTDGCCIQENDVIKFYECVP